MNQPITHPEMKEFLSERGITAGYRYDTLTEKSTLLYKDVPGVLEWIQRLESGDYPQAKEMLYDDSQDGGYCCLGVAFTLIELIPEDAGVPHEVEHLVTAKEFEEHPFLKGFVDDEHKGWFTSHLENTLTSLNDEYNFSFEEIAAVLRYKFDLYE